MLLKGSCMLQEAPFHQFGLKPVVTEVCHAVERQTDRGRVNAHVNNACKVPKLAYKLKKYIK